MVPYLSIPEVILVPAHLFGAGVPARPVAIQPFGTLVAIGVYWGALLALRQAQRLGLHQPSLYSFILWVVGFGFVGGHLFELLVYEPAIVRERPLALLEIWAGQSSVGGFMGATLGALAWGLRYRSRLLPYADTVASAFPVGWMMGRAGCAVAHDHPGVASDAWYAVAAPTGGYLDLGLIEMVLTIPLALTFLVLRTSPRPWGFYVGLMALAYAPTRFALDFLRVDDTEWADARYGALTPAQWVCLPLAAIGVALFWNALAHPSLRLPRAPVALRRRRRPRTVPAAVELPPALEPGLDPHADSALNDAGGQR